MTFKVLDFRKFILNTKYSNEDSDVKGKLICRILRVVERKSVPVEKILRPLLYVSFIYSVVCFWLWRKFGDCGKFLPSLLLFAGLNNVILNANEGLISLFYSALYYFFSRVCLHMSTTRHPYIFSQVDNKNWDHFTEIRKRI